MPALARPWPLPRPLDQVQPLTLFPLVTNAPQQRGCPRPTRTCVNLLRRSRSPSQVSPFTSHQVGTPRLEHAPLGANQVPGMLAVCREPRCGSRSLRPRPSALRKGRSLVGSEGQGPGIQIPSVCGTRGPSPRATPDCHSLASHHSHVTLHQEPNRNRAAGMGSNLQTRWSSR